MYSLLSNQFETLENLTRTSFSLKCDDCGSDISDEGYIIVGEKKLCNVCVDHL